MRKDIVGTMTPSDETTATSAEMDALVRDIAAHARLVLDFLETRPPALPAETARRASLLVSDILEEHKADSGLTLFPVFRILSLLNRTANALGNEESRMIGATIGEAVFETRALIGALRKQLPLSESPGFAEKGEILPPEKLSEAKPGTILLALDPAMAEKIAPLLKRFGHSVIVANTADDVFSALGFEREPPEARENSAHSVRYFGGDGMVRYSLSGKAAGELSARGGLPDILLGDLLSAGFAGFELQELVKSFDEYIDTRIIVISPFSESKCIARAIQLGADDYLGYDVEPSVLFARIESSIERRRLRARRQMYVVALAQARERLETELRRGAEYVRYLLPGKISSPTLSTDWTFLPSASLGGDLFGYHWLGDGRLAIFIIDVSGHGVQSALYSVTIFDTLRTEGLRNVDFGDPASVMRGLNHAFRMEERNSMLFTLWYGVWDEKSRILTHASAGSPPAILVVPGGGAIELKSGGMVAGADPDAEYEKLSIQVPRRSRLYLFSDGIYEFRTKDDSILGLEAFVQLLERTASGVQEGGTSIGEILKALASLSAGIHFQDDVSLLELRFD